MVKVTLGATVSVSPEAIVSDPGTSMEKSISKVTSEFIPLLPSIVIVSVLVGNVSPLQFKGSDQLVPSPPPSQVTAVASACWTGNDRNKANKPIARASTT